MDKYVSKYTGDLNREMVKSVEGKWCKLEDVDQLQADLKETEESFADAVKSFASEVEKKDKLQTERDSLEAERDYLGDMNDDLMAECDGGVVIKKLQAELEKLKVCKELLDTVRVQYDFYHSIQNQTLKEIEQALGESKKGK